MNINRNNLGISSTLVKQLQEENKQLKSELELYKQIHNFPTAVVYQMTIKTKNKQKLWINKQTITKKELLELDIDDEIRQLLSEKDPRYNDSDW